MSFEVVGEHNLRGIVRGDTWNGVPSIVITVNEAPPVIPASSARMQFRRDPDDGLVALDLSTDDDSIVIEDAANWEFSIPSVTPFPLGNGVWYYDFETIDTSGNKRTYFKGTITVQRDTTR